MKKNIPYYLLLFIVLMPLGSYAQLQMSSMMRENLSLLNPAAIDLDALQYRIKGNVEALFQQRWVGFEDNGVVDDYIFNLSFKTFSHQDDVRFNWGANMMYDKAGTYNNANINLQGSFTIPLNFRKGRNRAEYYNLNFLTIGINMGMEIIWFQYSKMYTEEEDPLILAEQGRSCLLLPRPGLGIYYHHYNPVGDAYFFGLSFPNVFPFSNRLYNFEDTINTMLLPPVFSSFGHLSLQIGYRKNLANSRYIELSAWSRTPIVRRFGDFPTMYNISLKYKVDKRFWMAVGAVTSITRFDFGTYPYRGNSHLSFSFGTTFSNRFNWLNVKNRRKRKGSQYQFGIAYQYPLGDLLNTNWGTYELFARFAQL